MTTAAVSALPPIAALFLTHFEDKQGQVVIYYKSVQGEEILQHARQHMLILDLPPGLIEHTTLPSGLHLLDSDLVFFTHGPRLLPGVGLFKGTEVNGVGRGRRMGTLGVVLGMSSFPKKLS